MSMREKMSDAARRFAPPRTAITPAVLFVAIFGIYLLTTARTSLSLDVWSANYASWLIATSGQPWLEGLSIPVLDQNPLREIWILEADNGHTVIGRAPGTIAAALPAYWLAQPDAMSIAPASVTAAFLTAAAVLFIYLTVRQTAAARYAVPVAFVFGLTTPVWSVAANGMWPHTVTVFALAGMAWSAAREQWWLVGVFGGVALWGRLHVAIIAAVVGFLIGAWRRRPDIVVKIGIPSGVGLLLLMAWTRWMYGSWSPMAAYDTSVFTDYAATKRLDVVNHLGFWVSPDRGLLIWTPILLLLAPATVRQWRTLPDWSRALVWGGLTYTVAQLILNRFSGGDTFYGYRLGLELLVCLTPACAISSLDLRSFGRRMLMPIVGLQFAVIYVGARFDGFYVTAEYVWSQNAFLNALAANPLTLTLIVCAGLLITFVSYRIWLNPRLESLWRR